MVYAVTQHVLFNSIVYAAKVSYFHFVSVLSVVTYLTFSQLYNVGGNMCRVPIIATRSYRFLAFCCFRGSLAMALIRALHNDVGVANASRRKLAKSSADRLR